MVKKLTIALIVATAVAVEAQTPITLVWDYDAASITNVANSNQVFYIYGTNNITSPVSTWPILTNMPADVTNVFKTNTIDATVSFKVSLVMTQQMYFFVATFSNFWGISGPSNIASTPSSNRPAQKLTPTRP